jgi:hypothetical protein
MERILMIKFYDTSSLLLKATSLHEEERFVISSITLQELENIKSSGRKDIETKHNARLVLHYLDEHDNYDIHIFTNNTWHSPIKYFLKYII